MTNAVSNALASKKEANDNSPRGYMMRFSEELTGVMPTHVQAQGDAWLRLAAGSLKTGKIMDDGPHKGEFMLEVAAINNPAAFMQALRRAASMGLQPGTEQFYLTPRPVKGRMEILGIVGYQGYIELMYRGGYVDSVIVETVHEGESFEFVKGRDQTPIHRIDWRAKRGELELVYAYAKMHSGAISPVIVLNKYDIEDIKKTSPSAKYNTSPWSTHPRQMWLKSAVRQLQKWVPWSIEVRGPGGIPVNIPVVPATPHEVVDAPLAVNGNSAPELEGVAVLQSHDPDQVVDAVLLDDPEPADEDEPEPEPTDPPMSKGQLRQMQAQFREKGFKDSADRHDYITQVLNIQVESSAALTEEQAKAIIIALEALPTPGEVPANVPSDSPASQ
jgi:recombination protein RecT